MKKIMLLIFALCAAPAEAQFVRAQQFVLSTGPCVLRSGSGTPEGAVVGNVCDTYWRTDTGLIYTKISGSGNTGWSTGGLSGSGTANTIAMWTGTSALGNSMISQASSDIVLDPVGNDVLPNTNYDVNLGSLQKKYLTLHAAELWVETLVAQNTLATIGGRVLVAPTDSLCADAAPGDTTLTFKYNNLANGHRIYFEANGQVEFMAVTSGATAEGCGFSYAVTRNLDGTGANQWYAGDAALNTGTTGNGFMDIYSVRGVKSGTEIGPSIVGNVRNSATYNDWTPRWAIGNLDGLYGYSGTTYGAAFGVPSGAWIKIDPTNGIRIGHGATTRIALDATTGDASFTGTLTSAAGTIGGWSIITGYLFSGSTSTARVGLHASDTATDVAIYAGDFNEGSAPFRVLHNGSLVATSATITGAITATSGSFTGAVTSTSGTIGGFTLASQYLYAGSGGTRAGISSDGTAAFWAGSETLASAPFRVTAAGALTATSATITGTISGSTISGNTISGGTISGTTISSSTATFGGSSSVTLDTNGVSFTSGTGGENRIKWSSGDYIQDNANSITVRSSSASRLETPSYAVHLLESDGSFSPNTSGSDLGSSGSPWRNLFLSSLSGAGTNRFVCTDNAGQVYDSGTTCDGSMPLALERIDQLEAEVARLLALLEKR